MPRLTDIVRTIGLTDAAAIIKALGESVVASTDSTPVNYARVSREFSPEIAEGIIVALNAAKMPGASSLFIGAGVDCSLEMVQQQLTNLRARTTPPVSDCLAAYIAKGIVRKQRWQMLGLTALPGVEQVTAALVVCAECQRVARMLNEVVNPLASDEMQTVETIKAAVAAWKD